MMQNKYFPKISVIVPSLNQGCYLRQCIDSILSQEYQNIELLIIDGESIDESVSIIKEFERNVSYWVSEPDNGQSDAINKGFKKASGEIVAWLNADDYYLPRAFDRVIESYFEDQCAPFYFGDGLRVDETGKTISKFFPTKKLTFNRKSLIMGLNYILQPSTFINSQSLKQVGYLDVELHYGMDSDLWMRLSGIGTPRAITATLSASREYATTKTASGSFERIEELRQIAEKHSGLKITPGVLCYFLDTFYRFAKQNDDIFPSPYLKDISRFWQKTADLFGHFNTDPNGFPREPKKKYKWQ